MIFPGLLIALGVSVAPVKFLLLLFLISGCREQDTVDYWRHQGSGENREKLIRSSNRQLKESWVFIYGIGVSTSANCLWLLSSLMNWLIKSVILIVRPSPINGRTKRTGASLILTSWFGDQWKTKHNKFPQSPSYKQVSKVRYVQVGSTYVRWFVATVHGPPPLAWPSLRRKWPNDPPPRSPD